MSTTVTETLTLTAEDVKAIRAADTVAFRIHEGRTTLEASLDRGWSEEPRIYTANQQRLFPMPDEALGGLLRVIDVAGSVRGYNDEGDRALYHFDTIKAFEMIHSAKYSEVWQSIASLLRAGDKVRLVFDADGHSNQITKAKGLHVDTLYLEIMRPSGQRLVFQVSSRTGYDNTARMIRRG